MGRGEQAHEAVAGAQADMARVQAAAAAIAEAISKVRPLADAATWQGPPAWSWLGDWEWFYALVQSCLDGLPAVQQQVIAQAQRTGRPPAS